VKTSQCYSPKAGTPSVARAYRTRFWWDLAAWVPFDYIALLVLGDFHAGSSIVARVPLLRLTRLVSTCSESCMIANCVLSWSAEYWVPVQGAALLRQSHHICDFYTQSIAYRGLHIIMPPVVCIACIWDLLVWADSMLSAQPDPL